MAVAVAVVVRWTAGTEGQYRLRTSRRRLPHPLPSALLHPDTMAQQQRHSTCYMTLADALLTRQRQEAEGRSKSRMVKEGMMAEVVALEGVRAGYLSRV
ncbi:hypothetical protein O3P69_016507 [Scylla paramamosain]|uniref:Uncharacterized protein n=1 Tax=Scylla paramamosain TaxID=85552 RepID=A0AAW0TEJ1_SCYPA